MKKTFTFVVNFRGGIYCSQVEANSIDDSLSAWLVEIKRQRVEIKHLGDHTLKELEEEIKDTDYRPILLNGLKNIWCTLLSSKQGSFNINIIQTDMS